MGTEYPGAHDSSAPTCWQSNTSLFPTGSIRRLFHPGAIHHPDFAPSGPQRPRFGFFVGGEYNVFGMLRPLSAAMGRVLF